MAGDPGLLSTGVNPTLPGSTSVASGAAVWTSEEENGLVFIGICAALSALATLVAIVVLTVKAAFNARNLHHYFVVKQSQVQLYFLFLTDFFQAFGFTIVFRWLMSGEVVNDRYFFHFFYSNAGTPRAEMMR